MQATYYDSYDNYNGFAPDRFVGTITIDRQALRTEMYTLYKNPDAVDAMLANTHSSRLDSYLALCGKQEHGGSLTLRERRFLDEYSKIAKKQGKDAVIRRENKTKRRKKKKRP